MSYRSILLNIDIDAPATSLIKLGVELGGRFDAKLIGCSSAQIIFPMIPGRDRRLDQQFIDEQRTSIQGRLDHLQKKFIDLAGSSVEIEWRSDIANPTDFLTRTACAADLIVTGSPEGADTGDRFRSTDVGNLILKAGRPVLLAASGAEHLPAKKILIAWKDSREARRAVADSLPLLVAANEVVIATVARKESPPSNGHTKDLVAYLARHGVRSKTETIIGKNDAEEILKFARTCHADLVVLGAYGHSRLREWVFGGVTISLIDEIRMSRFLSN